MKRFLELNPAIAIISDKSDGVIRSSIEKKRFIDSLKLEGKELITPTLEHGTRVEIARKDVGACDGLITDNPNFILSITVADCLPLFFFAPKKRVIGLVHAGCRGIGLSQLLIT